MINETSQAGCGHKWLNIPNSSLFTFPGWTRIFRLLRPNLRLHIIACKTSRLKIFHNCRFFYFALFKNTTTWIRACVSQLNFNSLAFSPRELCLSFRQLEVWITYNRGDHQHFWRFHTVTALLLYLNPSSSRGYYMHARLYNKKFTFCPLSK